MHRLTPANDIQTMMVDTLSRYLRERYPFDAHARTVRSGIGFMPELWTGLARDAGIPGAALPASAGGADGDLYDHALIMESLGYALAAEPYLSTAVIGAGLLRHSPCKLTPALLEDIAAGQAVLAFACAEPHGRYDLSAVKTMLRGEGERLRLCGHKAVVRNARHATHLLVTAAAANGGIVVVLADPAAPGISFRHYATIDGQQASEIYFNEMPVTSDQLLLAADATPLVERIADEAVIALCAEAIGVMRRLYEDTVSYVRQRKQFGMPVASFQVVQHRLADMLIQLEQAAAVTERAALGGHASASELACLASSAKVTVTKACRFIGQNAIQLHGGMGMTDALPLSHYFRRATVLESLFGTADHHLRRYAHLRDASPLSA